VQLNLTVPADDFDLAALERAVERLADVVAEHEHVRITVTTDFVGAVRSTVTDADYAARYEQNREFAVAVAKTITQDDSSIDLIVDAGLFSLSADPDRAEHAFEHEALHIAVAQRGESLNDLRIRQDLGGASGQFAGMAGVASEEYRVERALSDPGGSAHPDSPMARFGEALQRFDERIRDVSRQYEADRNVDAIYRAVLEAFHAMVTWTAYVVAKLDETNGSQDIEVPGKIRARVLGSAWHALSDTLRRLPAADVPTPREDLDRLAAVVARCLEDWLEHIGFSLTDTEDGGLHFGVLNAETWVP
jgi:hypothetical protein